MKRQLLAIACGALFTLAGPVRAGVIVVDAAGGGAFTLIQPAVNAAADGDTILVKPGSYFGFTIDGKELTVIGDGDPALNPGECGRVWIKNIADGKTVTLARLLVSSGSNPEALKLNDCVGAVRFVQCDFTGGLAGVLTNTNDVAFAACTLLAGNGASGHTCLNDIVTPGLPCVSGSGNDSLAMYDCSVTGGKGGNGGDTSGIGGLGLDVPGFVFASRSNIHGGKGGNVDCFYGCPSNGGASFRIPTGSTGWVLDNMVGGGLGGIATGNQNPSCPPTQPGASYPVGSPFTFSVPSIGFSIPSIAREGTYVTVKFTGPPGAHVFLNDEPRTMFVAVPSWRGVLLSPFPERNASGPGATRSRRWGVIPASGELTQVYKVPMLPAGVQAETRYLQAYRIGANGMTLGSFRTMTVLDSAF